MLHKNFIYLFFFWFLITSCQYEPFEEPFTPGLSAEIKESGILLNNFEAGDTIALGYTTTFNLTFADTYNEIFELNCFFETKKIKTAQSNTISFSLNPMSYSPGIYKLTIFATVDTESGSLANKLGEEKYIDEWVYYISVVHDYPYPIIIDSVEPEDGLLKLNWEPYKFNNIQYIQIDAVYSSDSTRRLAGSVRRTFNYPASDFVFLDSNYVGGAVWYQVSIKALDSIVKGPEFFYSEPPIKLYQVDQYKLAWEQCKYYRNFSKYVLHHNLYNTREFESITDTVAIIDKNNMKLGWDEDFYLNLYGHDERKYYYPQTNTLKVHRGIKNDSLEFINYNRKYDVYYARRNDSVWVVDNQLIPTTNKIKANNILVSRSGALVYSVSGKTLFQRDPVSFDIINTIDLTLFLPEYTESFYSNPYNMVLSDANIISFISIYNWYFMSAMRKITYSFAIDLNSQQEIYKKKSSFVPLISPDGEYMYAERTISQFINGAWVEKFMLPENDVINIFTWNSNDEFYIYYLDFVSGKYSIGKGSIIAGGITQYQETDNFYNKFNFDNYQSIVLEKGDRIRIYNFSDMSSYKEFEKYTYQHNWQLFNDHVFSKPYIININE